MSDFYPISPMVGITNTSYGAQAGVMDGKWAARVVRGKKIIAEKTINDLDLDALVGVIFGHARVEGLSRHAVAMCAGRLMQFARQYQQSGVCANYELPDLQRDGESTEPARPVGGAAEVPPVTSESVPQDSAVTPPSVAPLGAVPPIHVLNPRQMWLYSTENRAVLLSQLASYGAALSQGHLDAMVNNAADDLVRMWAQTGDSEEILRKFAAVLLSCSYESQLPKTGSDKATIETGRCEVLRVAKELDPSGTRTPAGYPCAYHEAVAKKVAALLGLKIGINTSSTGCIVTISI